VEEALIFDGSQAEVNFIALCPCLLSRGLQVIGYQIAAGCWSEFLPVLACFFLGMPQPLSSFLMIVISCVSGASGRGGAGFLTAIYA
jgi:hypothetical protein